MDNLNNIPNAGNWGDAASKLNDNFNKVKQAVTTIENASKNNKGYFSSLSALNTAFPNPKAGQTAYVYSEASSTKYYIYNAFNGGWVTASVEAPSIGVDISEYTKTGGSTKTTKEIEDDLAQLAGVKRLDDLTSGYFALAGDKVGTRLDSAGHSSLYFSVNPDEKITILGKARGENSRTYAITDKDGYILERAEPVSQTDEEPIYITVPENGAWMYVNHANDQELFGVYLQYPSAAINDRLSVSLDEIKNSIYRPVAQYEDLISGYFALAGEYAGERLSSGSTSSIVIPVNVGERYLLYGKKFGANSRTYAITDSSGYIIERYREIDVVDDLPLNITIPENGAWMYVNHHNDQLMFKLLLDVNSSLREADREDFYTEIKSTGDLTLGYFALAGEYAGERLSSDTTSSLKMAVSPGEKYIIYGKKYGANSRTYAITDEDGYILERCPEITIEEMDEEPIYITVPENGAWMYVNHHVAQDLFSILKNVGLEDLYEELSELKKIKDVKLKVTLPPVNIDWDGIEKRTLALCAVKKINPPNKQPEVTGYFFNEYPANNGKLYYSNTLDSPVEILDMGPSTWLNWRVVAVSPRHNTVITSQFDVSPGAGLKIWEDGAYHEVNQSPNMQAWLYNVGIDFFDDENGDEFCLFGEYSHDAAPSRRVWKGIYPYSDPGNWRVVLDIPSDGSSGSIRHIHQIRKDPFSDYIYCTTGDAPAECRIYYSGDDGETWSVLMDGQSTEILRMINFVFLEDRILWATDSSYHKLVQVTRDGNGLIDPASLEIIADLPDNAATNGMAFIEEHNLLFMYDRYYGNAIANPTFDEYLFDLATSKIIQLRRFKYYIKDGITNIFGNRGKCYLLHPNLSEPRLACGFSHITGLTLDLPMNDGGTFGSIYYEIIK